MKPTPSKSSRSWEWQPRGGNGDPDAGGRSILYFNRALHTDIRKLSLRRWSWRVHDDFEGQYGRGYCKSKKLAKAAARIAKLKVKFPSNKK